MIRNLLLAVAAVAAISAVAPATANADMCDKHGVGPGLIYKTACGPLSGTGGGGSTIHYVDSNGQHHKVSADDYRDVLKANR